MDKFELLEHSVSFQKGSNKKDIWIDADGMPVERHRVTRAEAINESSTKKIFKKALQLSRELSQFRIEIDKMIRKCHETLLKENGEELTEIGGFTIYNFSRNVKVVRDAKSIVRWDEGMMLIALEKFKSFLASHLTEEISFIRDIILSAFENRSGRFDTKEVNNILKHRNNPAVVDNKDFQDAIKAVEKAKKNGGKDFYDRVFVLHNGTWEELQLNFSKIDIEYDEEPAEGSAEEPEGA